MDRCFSCFQPEDRPWKKRCRNEVEEDFLKKYGMPRPNVEHVVVLMLENRTFDNVFGVFMDRRYQSGEIERSSWDRNGKPLYEYSNIVNKCDKKTLQKIRSVADDAGCFACAEQFLRCLHSAASKSPIQVDQHLPLLKKHKRYTHGEPHVFKVWSRDPKTEDIFSEKAMGVPNGDPAEKYHLLNCCLFEKKHVFKQEMAAPTMGGFAQQYYILEQAHLEQEYKSKSSLRHKLYRRLSGQGDKDLEEEVERWADSTDFEKKRSPAMHVYLPEQMSVFTQLATVFGLSDTYFASAPCQTWPNRLFALNGHCYGYVNNLAYAGGDYDEEPNITFGTIRRMYQFNKLTLLDKLLQAGVDWAVYAGDWALALLLHRSLHTLEAIERKYQYQQLRSHVESSTLPEFTWIEPQYLEAGGKPPNDMHPPHNTLYAQELVRDVYNTLRSNEEIWKKTLFIVNCDEGVGIFDHVSPPLAPNPGKQTTRHPFIDQHRPHRLTSNPYERYGTRTPCLLASPLLDPGSVLRPDKKFSATPEGKLYPFDHTSVIRTVLDLFVGTEHYLTERDRQAPSFAPYLRQTAREDLGPLDVKLPSQPPALHPSKAGKKRNQCHNVSLLAKTIEGEGDGSHPHQKALARFAQHIHPDRDHPEKSHVLPKYFFKQEAGGLMAEVDELERRVEAMERRVTSSSK